MWLAVDALLEKSSVKINLTETELRQPVNQNSYLLIDKNHRG